MPENPIQNDLLELFGQTRTVIRGFIAGRTAAEQAETGTEQAWSGKDLLANVACWMDYMVQRMAYVARGETPPRDVDFDAVSQQAFQAYQHRPWEDAVAYVEQALGSLTTTVQGFTDEQLTANNAYGDSAGDPLWQEIRANGFIYPLQEFEKFYQRRGDQVRATDIHAMLSAVLGEEKPLETDLISAPILAEQRQSGASPLVIDVRGPQEYAAGHVAGAINIPLPTLATQLEQIPRDGFVVTYCNMHHKGASRGEQAAVLLTEQGYRAAALDGGYPQWKAAGLPVETA